MTTTPSIKCMVCDATARETNYHLRQLRCGHVLCGFCEGVNEPCPLCEAQQPVLDEPTPLEQSVYDGACMIWAYGELYGIPEEERQSKEHLAMILMSLRVWAESVGIDTAAAWRDAWQQSVAVKQARKAG